MVQRSGLKAVMAANLHEGEVACLLVLQYMMLPAATRHLTTLCS